MSVEAVVGLGALLVLVLGSGILADLVVPGRRGMALAKLCGLAALGAAAVIVQRDRAREERALAQEEQARAQALQLTAAAQAFHVKFGDPPARLNDLVKPPEGKPVVEPAALVDPWGKPFQFDARGPKNGGLRPDVWTVTPQGKVIGNWPQK
jgi:hypothetical protein